MLAEKLVLKIFEFFNRIGQQLTFAMLKADAQRLNNRQPEQSEAICRLSGAEGA